MQKVKTFFEGAWVVPVFIVVMVATALAMELAWRMAH